MATVLTDHTEARRLCTAHSSRTGDQCKNWPIRGGTVCRFHGGGAPQVKRSAKARLAELVDPAIARLAKLIETDRESVAIKAIIDVLDRNGLAPPKKIELDGAVSIEDRIAAARRRAHASA